MTAMATAAITYLSGVLATALHTWTPVERALGVLAAAFVGGWILARPLAWAVRIVLVIAGVLVAAQVAGLHIG